MNTNTATATSVNSKFEHSGASFGAVSNANVAIIDCLKNNKGMAFSVESGIINNIVTSNFGIHPYPVVCIINGAGGNGKDTFINAVAKHCSVQNLSSVDVPKDVVDIMLNMSNEWDENALVEKEKKTTKYRQFLHAVKMAWSDFNDGPNGYLMHNLKELLNEHKMGRSLYDMVFFHVREKEEIEHLKNDIMSKIGVPVITVLINGLIDPDTYAGGCEADAQVTNYKYDLNIMNTPGNMAVFEMQAMMFANLIKVANTSYGIYNATITATNSNTVGGTVMDSVVNAPVIENEATRNNVHSDPNPIGNLTGTAAPAPSTPTATPIQVVNPAVDDGVSVETVNPVSSFH